VASIDVKLVASLDTKPSRKAGPAASLEVNLLSQYGLDADCVSRILVLCGIKTEYICFLHVICIIPLWTTHVHKVVRAFGSVPNIMFETCTSLRLRAREQHTTEPSAPERQRVRAFGSVPNMHKPSASCQPRTSFQLRAQEQHTTEPSAPERQGDVFLF